MYIQLRYNCILENREYMYWYNKISKTLVHITIYIYFFFLPNRNLSHHWLKKILMYNNQGLFLSSNRCVVQKKLVFQYIDKRNFYFACHFHLIIVYYALFYAYTIFHHTWSGNTTFALSSRERKWHFRLGYGEKYIFHSNIKFQFSFLINIYFIYMFA